jgi:hypothetical protein
MPLDRNQLARLMQNPAQALMEAQQAELAAMAGGNVPVQLPGMTLKDIEDELRERAKRQEALGDRTIVRTTESLITMNRQWMAGVAGGMVALQNQVNELREAANGNVIDNNPKGGKLAKRK